MRPPLRHRVRRLVASLVALPLALLVGAATGAAAAPASSAQSMPGRHLEVMSRNLYLGADLTPLVTANTPDKVAAAVQQILGQVVASNPPKRMGWVADEIAGEQPDLVGLQEAALWQIQTPTGATITYDFTQLIVDALAAKGLDYRVAVSQKNFDSAVQLAQANLPARFADHDVILVNAAKGNPALQVLDSGAAHYSSQLVFPTLLGPVDFGRGYVYTDVKSWGKTWRFVNTHFEAYPGFGGTPHDYTSDQARELLSVLPAGLPTVIAGDLNSRRDNPLLQGAAVLMDEGGFADAWEQVHPGEPGYTCCRAGNLAGGTLDERIDYVLTRGQVVATSAARVGVDPVSATPPMWPSDHAGVMAGIAVGPQPKGVGKALVSASR